MEEYFSDEEIYVEKASVNSSHNVEPSALQRQYIDEQLRTNPDIDVLAADDDLSDIEDEGSLDTTVKSETGSQIARSIISNIFRRIELKNLAEESFDSEEADGKDIAEIEMVAEKNDGYLRSSQSMTSYSPLNQTPRTSARISDWINNIEGGGSRSGISYDDIHTIGGRSNHTRIDSYEDITNASDDDQPSGYTTLLSPGMFEVSAFDSPRSRDFQLSSPLVAKSTASGGSLRSRLNRLNQVDFVLSEKEGMSTTPRNRYMKIVETTTQKLQKDEDGIHTIDTVHTLEKSEKSLDPPFLSSSTILMVVALGLLLLLLLQLVGFLPLYHHCGNSLKTLSNNTI